MICRLTHGVLKFVIFAVCVTSWMQGTVLPAQDSRAIGFSGTEDGGRLANRRPSHRRPYVPENSVVDPGIIPSRQSITPAGMQSVFESRVDGIAFGENGDSIYAAVLGRKGSYVYRIDLGTNRMVAVLSADVSSGMQGLVYDPVSRTPLLSGLSGGAKSKMTSAQLVALSGSGDTLIADGLGSQQIASVSVARAANSRGQRLAVVALTFNDQAGVVDLNSRQILYKVKTGIAPFGTAVNEDSSVAWVSNWGGRFPRAGEESAATGPEPNADQVLVDDREWLPAERLCASICSPEKWQRRSLSSCTPIRTRVG